MYTGKVYKTRHRTYNFIFLLSVEGSGPLSLVGCRGFGLGPACRALAGGTPRFRKTERKKRKQFRKEDVAVSKIIYYKLYREFDAKDYIVCRIGTF